MLSDYLSRPLKDAIPVMQDKSVRSTHYFGIPTQRCPNDFWIYQEILHDTDPEVIVEVGVYRGGQTLALAHLCDARGKGLVIGVEPRLDRVDERVRCHPRVRLFGMDGISALPDVARMVGSQRVLVIEDSDHTYVNTLNVLNGYASLCQPGNYLICEDTICHHGLDIDPSVDPYRAVETFLQGHPEFERDYAREGFVLTWNPGGFLRRRA